MPEDPEGGPEGGKASADAAPDPQGVGSRRRDPPSLVDASRRGDRTATARLISLVERGGAPARDVARLTFAEGGRAYTVGITGAPGAGKSTLTDRLIAEFRRGGDAIGVLAVDPSSPFSGGALLGDRVRMQAHTLDERVFIRSMASRGHLGGLALATPDAIGVLSAAGLAVVLVETVGVGQVEIEVAGATDTTVVVVNPGWGDAIQANKAGLLEVADIFVINKADRPGADETRRDLEQMLDLGVGIFGLRPRDRGHHAAAGDEAGGRSAVMTATGVWRPPILLSVASAGQGVGDLRDALASHRRFLQESGELTARRRRRLAAQLHQVLVRRVEADIEALEGGGAYDEMRTLVLERRMDPYTAAATLLTRLDGG